MLAAGSTLPLAGGTFRAQAQQAVDLVLVLAIDCSYSVDAREYNLQVGGLAAAVRHADVVEAIGAGPYGAVSIAVVQWSSEASQVLALPHTIVRGAETAADTADIIADLPRLAADGATSISAALDFSSRVAFNAPYPATRYVIDVSGDGRNNNGPALPPARDAAIALGITVNGLAILDEWPTLDIYFRRELIGGPGAFVVAADDYDGYREAILRKLLREIGYSAVS